MKIAMAAGLVVALVLGTVGGLAVMTGLYLHAREQAARAMQAERDAVAAATDEKKARETAQVREGETTAVLGFVENQILAAVRPRGRRMRTPRATRPTAYGGRAGWG